MDEETATWSLVMHQYHFLPDPIPMYFTLKLVDTWLIPILCHRGIHYIKTIYFPCCLYLVITLSSLKVLLKDSCPFIQTTDNICTSVMVYAFHRANSHLEMKLNDIIIVSVMVSDAYTITDTNPIPQKMANTDISIGASLLVI